MRFVPIEYIIFSIFLQEYDIKELQFSIHNDSSPQVLKTLMHNCNRSYVLHKSCLHVIVLHNKCPKHKNWWIQSDKLFRTL